MVQMNTIILLPEFELGVLEVVYDTEDTGEEAEQESVLWYTKVRALVVVVYAAINSQLVT